MQLSPSLHYLFNGTSTCHVLTPIYFLEVVPYTVPAYEDFSKLLNKLGVASAQAQYLPKPITNLQKWLESKDRIYLKLDKPIDENCDGNVSIIGLLRVGERRLYVSPPPPRPGQLVELYYQTCILDFYVVEKYQRQSIGHSLFSEMLTLETPTKSSSSVSPSLLAYDKPSPKLIAFIAKYYGLTDYLLQGNNFVLFNEFWISKFDLNINCSKKERGKLAGERERRKVDDRLKEEKERIERERGEAKQITNMEKAKYLKDAEDAKIYKDKRSSKELVLSDQFRSNNFQKHENLMKGDENDISTNSHHLPSLQHSTSSSSRSSLSHSPLYSSSNSYTFSSDSLPSINPSPIVSPNISRRSSTNSIKSSAQGSSPHYSYNRSSGRYSDNTSINPITGITIPQYQSSNKALTPLQSLTTTDLLTANARSLASPFAIDSLTPISYQTTTKTSYINDKPKLNSTSLTAQYLASKLEKLAFETKELENRRISMHERNSRSIFPSLDSIDNGITVNNSGGHLIERQVLRRKRLAAYAREYENEL